MKITIEIYRHVHHADTDKILDRVFSILLKTQKQLETIMAEVKDFQAQFDRIGGAVSALADDITTLKGAITGKGMSEADEATALSLATALADKVTGIASSFAAPVDTTTPPATDTTTVETPVASTPAADGTGTAQV